MDRSSSVFQSFDCFGGFRHKLEGAIRDNTDAVAKVLTQDTAAPGCEFHTWIYMVACGEME
jgi:hypothetical protein